MRYGWRFGVVALIFLAAFGMALIGLRQLLMAGPAVPTISEMDTVAVEQRITDDRIARVQADADQAMALCGYARSEAAMNSAKSDWLRAQLLSFYRRYGQGRMATRLSRWPGGDSEPMGELR